jgi:hypothetical protein
MPPRHRQLKALIDPKCNRPGEKIRADFLAAITILLN